MSWQLILSLSHSLILSFSKIMNRVTHFEIPSDNPETSRKFYSDTFGWTFQKFGDFDYWLINTGPDDQPGIHGGLTKRNHPGQPVTNSIEVPDLSAAIQAVEKNGGTIVVQKMPIPGVGWLAFFKDPDQNIFGIMQTDSTAG